ncbi:MAG: hypothetical protein WD544_00405 [Patescibacteria group bacterium]
MNTSLGLTEFDPKIVNPWSYYISNEEVMGRIAFTHADHGAGLGPTTRDIYNELQDYQFRKRVDVQELMKESRRAQGNRFEDSEFRVSKISTGGRPTTSNTHRVTFAGVTTTVEYGSTYSFIDIELVHTVSGKKKVFRFENNYDSDNILEFSSQQFSGLFSAFKRSGIPNFQYGENGRTDPALRRGLVGIAQLFKKVHKDYGQVITWMEEVSPNK